MLPTLLTVLGLPTAQDHVGEPMASMLIAPDDASITETAIASYETFNPIEAVPPGSEAAESEQERLEQLRALGYLD